MRVDWPHVPAHPLLARSCQASAAFAVFRKQNAVQGTRPNTTLQRGLVLSFKFQAQVPRTFSALILTGTITITLPKTPSAILVIITDIPKRSQHSGMLLWRPTGNADRIRFGRRCTKLSRPLNDFLPCEKVSPASPSSPLFLLRIYSFFLLAIYMIQFRHFRRRFEFSELKPYNNLLRSASRRFVPIFIFNH